MTEPTEPRLAEAIPVTLMRIEGMVGGVAKDVANLTERLTEVRAELVVQRGDIGVIKSQVQQLQSDQASAAKDLKAADKAREDTADALEKQNTTAVAKAKDAVDAKARESVSKWSIPSRTITVIVAAAAVGVLLLTWIRG